MRWQKLSYIKIGKGSFKDVHICASAMYQTLTGWPNGLRLYIILRCHCSANWLFYCEKGAQWLSGRAHDSRPKGRRLEPNRRHCVVS